MRRVFIKKDDTCGVWLSKLKTSITPGMKIPMKQDKGNIGNYFETILEDDGFNLNPGSGPDLELGIEVKTRKIEAQSAFTIGSMSVKKLKKTTWKKSNIFKKSQIMLLITYSDEDSVVTEVDLLDLRDLDIQARLRHAYILGRREICKEYKLDGPTKTKYIAPSSYAYFEWPSTKKYSGTYEFRLANGKFETLKSIANNVNDSGLFSWGKPHLEKKVKKIKTKAANVENGMFE